MVPALSKNKRGVGRGARSPDPILSAALGESLCAMAGEHSRLVHQPPGGVGTSDSCLVQRIQTCRGRYGERQYSRPDRIAGRRMGPTSRHTRYLVFLLVMGL